MRFTKIHGTGNDFVLITDLNNDFVGKEKDLAEKICHRRFGVGADGVIFVRNSSIADTQMVIYNSDGSYAEMCGNGIRCFAKYVYDNKIVRKDEITIETGDGIKIAYLNLENEKVTGVKIDMGTYTFEPSKIPVNSNDKVIDFELKENDKIYKVTTLLLGVPHTIIFGELDNIDVNEGKAVEFNELYPARTNVNFCEVVHPGFVKVKTWERGAGPTMACGTGSCAAVVVANMFGKTDNVVKVSVPGGEMIIELTEDKRVFMTGPAVTVFEGEM
ncbi:diaminopimelate epimerase [Clostridium grantii]|uniref:Diaminopimelate epimerase n=1 Tax=Clostridium grantii DSM 8605 TaxID=1121316 RepID=A0A1M5SGM1_9CLOT|nr:diaminopimelate epimerase [Clostridium grantii]SHH37666.1 diaminopimelate epimerase [Clostridium grantii DSM 8605]